MKAKELASDPQDSDPQGFKNLEGLKNDYGLKTLRV